MNIYNKISKMKKSDAKKHIKEQILAEIEEAKKTKKAKPVPSPDEPAVDVVSDLEADLAADDSGEDDVDMTIGGDEEVGGGIEAVQKYLNKALKAAKGVGDKKLVRQVGNVLTYVTRTQISSEDQF